jgi:predicted membrane-bound spermidine synthase
VKDGDDRSPQGRGATGLLALVALAGFGTMAVELSAVRVLSPWFGTSAGVWTNVIGVVLLALAVGYRLGAVLARKASPRRNLALALLAGAACTGWIPALAAPVARFFLPADLTLEGLAPVLHWGSLATALLLFLPSALALGCVCPLAVEVLQREGGGHAGDAGGRVLAWSTLGGLAGTFATTHLALPVLGLRGTLLLAGLLLAVPGLLLLLRAPIPRKWAAPLLLAFPLAALAPEQLAGDVPEGWRILDSRLSVYQSLRVVEDQHGNMRRLQVNEGLDSFQSIWQPDPGLLPLGYYYNYFAAPPWWAGEGAEGKWEVLLLGAGAGTAARVISGAAPAACAPTFVAVELDDLVLELGRLWFGLEDSSSSMQAVAGDARAAVRALSREGRTFPQIILDAYANQTEIPPHLCSLEFFQETLLCLDPGGWLQVNVGGFGLSDPVVRAVAYTLSVAIEQPVLALRVPFSRNVILVARSGGRPPEPGGVGWSIPALQRHLSPLEIPGTWRWFSGEEDAPLTDDRNPVERLQRISLRRGWHS